MKQAPYAIHCHWGGKPCLLPSTDATCRCGYPRFTRQPARLMHAVHVLACHKQRRAEDAAARRDAEFEATLAEVVTGIIGGRGVTAETQEVSSHSPAAGLRQRVLPGLAAAACFSTECA
jgi:hypothetical protein